MRIRSALLALVLALVALALAACGGSSGPTSLDDGPPSAVASVDVVEGASLEVEVLHTSDTVTAVLRDASGNPVSGDLASFEVNGDGERTCGFWEATTLQANASGEVKNVLHAGEVAWTGTQVGLNCHYRVVHSSEGAPEPVVDSVHVRPLPGPPETLRVLRILENGTLDADGDTGDGRVNLQEVWIDSVANPTPYTVELTGPAHVDSLDSRREWLRLIVPDSPGSGTLQVWSAPDSARTVTGSFEVTSYGPNGEELHICLEIPEGIGSKTTCNGPPEL